MGSQIAEKQKVVEKFSEKMGEPRAVYLVDYLGMTVEEINDLRRRMRQESIHYKVLKNTLLKRLLEKKGIKGLDDFLTGVNGVAAGADEVAPARLLTEFAKKNERNLPKVKVAYIDGQVFTASDVEKVAKSPGKKELIGMLASALNAPIVGLAQVLNTLITQLPTVINAVIEKKEKEQK